ncbi:TPA: hypothetical protein ACXNW8_001296 [Clostridium botulinum]|uniref:hypothetical protein n=1 Tax=Clostridium botulinum TaxID=1491 RepID=UPI001C9B5C43|nr:hypothetical protein [Clostridium botulinum]MBY6909500.1 hypothetical protein [Clostridium botulinum]
MVSLTLEEIYSKVINNISNTVMAELLISGRLDVHMEDISEVVVIFMQLDKTIQLERTNKDFVTVSLI